VDDAVAAVALLRGRPSVDKERVFVIGHSLGAYLVPRIAAQDECGRIAGFVLLAGATRPIEDLTWEQFNYLSRLDGELTDTEQTQLNQLKALIDRVKSPDLGDAPLKPILGAPASYWLDLRGYDPARQAVDVERPMLILQGERDYQVTMVDFRNWKDALSRRHNVELKSYADLNHLFVKGSGKSTPAEYSVRGNVSETVVDDIARWIERH
jgi:alpha-beta hydrolase superfamily lysophospholipase